MSKFRVEGIINKRTRKTDEENKIYIGKIVSIDLDSIEKEKSADINIVDEAKYIRTSKVKNCFIDSKDVYLETNNTAYKFTKIDS